MLFDFTKGFSGRNRAKNVNGVYSIDELASLFSGQSESNWSAEKMLSQYGKSLYVFAGVNKIATKVASVELMLYRILNAKGDTEEVFQHDALDLMYRINPFQTKAEFLKTSWINKKLTGEAFWLKVRNSRGKVVELWNLRPDLVTVVSDPELYIKHYEFQAEDGGKKEIFDPEDIVYFKDPNPLNQFRGMSPLNPAKSRIETELSATAYQRDFFRNNARPDALLLTEETIDTEQKTQITSAWEERHQGKEKSSRIGFLEGGMKYQQVSISQKEMDYIESLKFTREDILVALGVPKSVITSEAATFATADSDYRVFLSETIVPEMEQLVETVNEMIIQPDFGEELFIDFVDPTPSDREATRNDMLAGYGRWLTINEIREELNLPAIEGGNIIPPLAGQSPISFIQEPGQGEEPVVPEVDESNTGADKQVRVHRGKRIITNTKLLLRGKPNLRYRFMLADIIKQETEALLKEKGAKKRKKKGAKAGKKEEKIKLKSLFENDKERSVYYNLINKRLDNRSKKFEKQLLGEAAAQEKRAIANLKKLEEENKGFDKKKFRYDQISKILNKDDEIRIFSVFALPFLLDFARQGGEDVADLTSEDFDMTEALERALQKRSKFFATSVTDTTFKLLTETLTQGINAGEGIEDLTTRVREVYNDYPDWRASLIARTETTFANNEGMLDQFNQSEVIQGKEWIATLDSATRDSHAAINGQTVGKNALFSNGLRFPGDETGSAKETINCRCVMAPTLAE